MKQQKRHKTTKKGKSAKDSSKYLSWSFIVPACAYLLWVLRIYKKTLFELEWRWLTIFAIIGFAVGVIRLVKDKEIIWNWKEYLGGFFYSLIHSVSGIIVFFLLCTVVVFTNYYIPSNRPYYEEPAKVLSKHFSNYYRDVTPHYNVKCQFKNERIGTRIINNHKLYDQAQIGDTYIFTLQNGFFNIPVIKDKAKQ